MLQSQGDGPQPRHELQQKPPPEPSTPSRAVVGNTPSVTSSAAETLRGPSCFEAERDSIRRDRVIYRSASNAGRVETTTPFFEKVTKPPRRQAAAVPRPQQLEPDLQKERKAVVETLYCAETARGCDTAPANCSLSGASSPMPSTATAAAYESSNCYEGDSKATMEARLVTRKDGNGAGRAKAHSSSGAQSKNGSDTKSGVVEAAEFLFSSSKTTAAGNYIEGKAAASAVELLLAGREHEKEFQVACSQGGNSKPVERHNRTGSVTSQGDSDRPANCMGDVHQNSPSSTPYARGSVLDAAAGDRKHDNRTMEFSKISGGVTTKSKGVEYSPKATDKLDDSSSINCCNGPRYRVGLAAATSSVARGNKNVGCCEPVGSLEREDRVSGQKEDICNSGDGFYGCAAANYSNSDDNDKSGCSRNKNNCNSRDDIYGRRSIDLLASSSIEEMRHGIEDYMDERPPHTMKHPVPPKLMQQSELAVRVYYINHEWKSVFSKTLVVLYMIAIFLITFRSCNPWYEFFYYLTLQSWTLELLYFSFSLYLDLLSRWRGGPEYISKVSKAAAQALSEVVFALQVVVVLFFWAVVYPQESERSILWELNCHGAGLLLMLGDYLYRFTGFSLRNHKFVITFAFLYSVLHIYVVVFLGKSIYPGIDFRSIKSGVIFFAGLSTVVLTHKTVYLISNWTAIKKDVKSVLGVSKVLLYRQNSFDIWTRGVSDFGQELLSLSPRVISSVASATNYARRQSSTIDPSE